MTYQVSIYRQGTLQKVVNIVADSAIEAISQVEAGYKKMRVKMPWLDSTPVDDKRPVEWTGYDFEAREVEG